MNLDAIGPGIIAIVSGIIGLAIIAVLVSQKAQTSSVLTGAGSALSTVINAAVSPVSGSNTFGSTGQTTQGTSS